MIKKFCINEIKSFPIPISDFLEGACPLFLWSLFLHEFHGKVPNFLIMYPIQFIQHFLHIIWEIHIQTSLLMNNSFRHKVFRFRSKRENPQNLEECYTSIGALEQKSISENSAKSEICKGDAI